MSFVEDALVLLAQQSVGGSNLYSYAPGNVDGSATVGAANYFSQSRFVGQDGWVNGFILCTLTDGVFIYNVSTDGATANLFSANNPVTTAQVSQLLTSVTGYILVNMGGDNYSLNDNQAIYSLIIAINTGDGTKSLNFPASSSATKPSVTTIWPFLSNGFTVTTDGGGTSVYINKAAPQRISIVSGNVANIDTYADSNARGETNGVTSVSTAAYSLTDIDKGSVAIGTRATAQTFTIALGNLVNNLTCRVYCSGAGGITIAGAGGVTVTGHTTVATGASITIARDALTENYYCF